ncbi:hypothetical protein FD08_GL002103 [Lentilactobacillus parakefiri DSM 10551]|nr:hypothetical protein FD08_GL002103 [Lentilactobacillus parakefiri DSM 10551]
MIIWRWPFDDLKSQKEDGTNSFAFVMATLITTSILPKAATNGRSLPFSEKMQPFQNQE